MGILSLLPVRVLECVFGSLLMIDKRFSGAEAVNEIQLSVFQDGAEARRAVA